MGSPDIIESANEADEKLSASSNTTDVKDVFPGRLSIDELSPIEAARTRRPTLAVIKSNVESEKAAADEIELAKHEKWTAKRIAKASWAYVTTIKVSSTSPLAYFRLHQGFLITIYFLNIVAWGGMLFLLLVNAAPAMCNPTCDDLYSPRKECTYPFYVASS
jgi:Protein of unknown function (DUF2985)